MVLKEGVDIEQGTHQELLAIENGVYSGLVNAQKLDVLAEDEHGASDIPHEPKNDVQSGNIAVHSQELDGDKDQRNKSRGFLGSIGLFLYEQRAHWLFYLLALIGAAGGGCKCGIFHQSGFVS